MGFIGHHSPVGQPYHDMDNREMIASLHISLVLHGTHKEDNGWGSSASHPPRGEEEEDPFAVPKEMGIFQEISRCGFMLLGFPFRWLLRGGGVCLQPTYSTHTVLTPTRPHDTTKQPHDDKSSDCDLSVREIIARIQRNQDQFLSKVRLSTSIIVSSFLGS